MSRQSYSGDTPRSHRPRSNTNTFSTFTGWRRKPEIAPVQTSPTPQLPLEALIQTLTPPAVPSPANARALAAAITTQYPLPAPTLLLPIVASLCANDSPLPLQIAGYDIISAYWETNEEGSVLTTSERVAFFSLFVDAQIPWSQDIWEPRLRAFRALTKLGMSILGTEAQFLEIVESWIAGAFRGLLTPRSNEEAASLERERSINILSSFLSSVLDRLETAARLSEDDWLRVLSFFADLVRQSLDSAALSESTKFELLTTSTSQSHERSSPRPLMHRRHPSSLSIPSIASSIPPSASPPPKDPANLAIAMYLGLLSTQLKTMLPRHLNVILPVLFRALAYYASPLPRLTITAVQSHTSDPEDRITEILNSLFTGPYANTCMVILKQHLSPPKNSNSPLLAQIQTSVGAHRTLRNYIRRGLYTRLARAYIARESSMTYTPSGAPGRMDLERNVIERAWLKDDVPGWTSAKLGRILSSSVEAWIDCDNTSSPGLLDPSLTKAVILDEVAGTLKDLLEEVHTREEDESVDREEASSIGQALYSLAKYVRSLKNRDGSPYVIPLTQPTDATTPFLRTLSSLLSGDLLISLDPPISITLLSIADHLSDADTAKIPLAMHQQHDLSPTSSSWLEYWKAILLNPIMFALGRPSTRRAVADCLTSVYLLVKDMPTYRMVLAELVYECCVRQLEGASKSEVSSKALWAILGCEAVLRIAEAYDNPPESNTKGDGEEESLGSFIALLIRAAYEEGDEIELLTWTAEPQSPTATPETALYGTGVPGMQSEYTSQSGREAALPSVMSLFSSFTTSSSRSQSRRPGIGQEGVPLDTSAGPLLKKPMPIQQRSVCAVSALVAVFMELSFTHLSLHRSHINIALHVYLALVDITIHAKSFKARLTSLQFLMRLRADRDHRLYYVDKTYDPDGHVQSLANLVQKASFVPSEMDSRTTPLDDHVDEVEPRSARPRISQERDGRRFSRGRGQRPSHSTSSRSRSRATPILPSIPLEKSPPPAWILPEILPFDTSKTDTPSEGIVSYHTSASDRKAVLPISLYLTAVNEILVQETNWEVMSYVLCHLPVQLANKHFFCGPKSRAVMAKLLTCLCTGTLNGTLASQIVHWPQGLKARDAQGLAYHTLSVLISYRRCFDIQLRHLLVEVFQNGLNESVFTIKCCLHALTLSAYDLQASVTRCLSRILEQLSQIMSNPDMAVHIINFLCIVGSIPEMHANLTEADFKMIFGVALQYLQQHGSLEPSVTISWALSQHVRIMSYYLVYEWFLAIKLPDRARHIPFITRQLLLINEGRDEIDEQSQVCFDWLARYAYGSADPRPTKSLLSDLVLLRSSSEPSPVGEKTWIFGNSVVTIRALEKLGWIEAVSHRPSGVTRFICRLENVPMVGAGDVDPDLISRAALLLMDRSSPMLCPPESCDGKSTPPDGSSFQVRSTIPEYSAMAELKALVMKDAAEIISDKQMDSEPVDRPDPIAGYVWSGSAPSQRRKEVSVDPAFFTLQLSSYPEKDMKGPIKVAKDDPALSRLFRSLERTPVIDTHKVGIMYVAPGQMDETEILRNTHGSPAYTRFLEGLGRLVHLRGQLDVYVGSLEPDLHGEYTYAWWDDIGQILFHTATMMPTRDDDYHCIHKKSHIGNDNVRIIWNDSGFPYRFDTLTTSFQFVNIVIEPHSLGVIAAFSNNIHEHEYFKVTIQRADGMPDFGPIGDFKIISAENLPFLVRQLSLLADWFTSVFINTEYDTKQIEMTTNWRERLRIIKNFRKQQLANGAGKPQGEETYVDEDIVRDFTLSY